MKRHTLFFILLLLSPLHSMAKRQIPVHVTTTHLPGNVVNSNNEGFFIDLLHELFKGSHFYLNIKMFPIKRAVSQFYDGDATLLASHMEGLHGDQYHEIKIGFHDGMTYFTNQERDPSLVSNKKSWKRIGTIKGWNTPNSMIRKDQEVLEVDSIAQLKKLLINGRIQAVAGFRYLLFYSFIHQKKDKIIYNPKLLLDNRNVVFLIKKTIPGNMAARHIRKRLKHLIENGTYKRLLKKYNIPRWLLNDEMNRKIYKN